MVPFFHSFKDRFESFLKENDLIRNGDTLLLAVSGGLDSMVMLHLFQLIAKEWSLSLAVVHVNHQLRGEESDDDEVFVRESAEAMGLPFHGTRVDTVTEMKDGHFSKQVAARQLRYRFFESVRLALHANAVATAHQADDNAETVLMNALRGAGVRGLAGIPIRRTEGGIIRPLLFAYRKEIRRFASEAGVGFREDSSNASLQYTRNIIRHRIMPNLLPGSPLDIPGSLNRISSLMRSVLHSIENELPASLQRVLYAGSHAFFSVSIEALHKEPLQMQEEIILHIFRKMRIEATEEKVHACLALTTGTTGHSVRLSMGHMVYRDRDHLVFDRPHAPQAFEERVELGKEYHLPGFRFASEPLHEIPSSYGDPHDTAVIDGDRLGPNLIIRSWKKGDWFIPFGMISRKKISDFFTDQKIPLPEKQRIPLLESNGDVVWICGHRLDERFKITPSTRHAVRLTFEPIVSQ